MLYNSTQNAKEVVSAAQAIAQGISKDGGLFVPQEFPKYDENTFKALLKTDYKGRAKKVFSDFLSDFTEEEISDCVEKAYTAQKFGGENPAPISYCNLDGTTLNILELWHGPTCAFKDMALQILPHLLLIDHIARIFSQSHSRRNMTARRLLFSLLHQAIQARLLLKALKMLTTQRLLFSILLTV